MRIGSMSPAVRAEIRKQWHCWYAWRPVRIGPLELCWLEWVDRRWRDWQTGYTPDHWEYRK